MLTVQEIIEINEKYNENLPVVEVDSFVNLFDIWDGNGETPDESYSYTLDDYQSINYLFTVLNPQDRPEEQAIRILGVELI